ncbi:MAG TPA: diguanylate cyclase [Tepidisphaeraceae bacterium]|nr:diguanylate cyclase [Tepidisphaeraceae bacterium]
MTKRKLLVADNIKMIHALVRAHLADEPVEIYSATDGDEALEMARRLMPDVLLLDVEMPDPDGWEVCRILKEDPQTSGISIIFLSADADAAQKIRGLELGAVDYVTKPWDPAELKARVRSALRTKELIDLLSEQAMIDGLTGLRNRSYFDQRLVSETSGALRHKTPLSCVMADVDHFKQFNDRYGHAIGDDVLRQTCRILNDAARLSDIVCRYGGEEIVALLPLTSLDQAVVYAERARSELESFSLAHRSGELKITASFGVAELSHTGGENLLIAADQALYEAKRAGRNRVCVSSTHPIETKLAI